MLFGIASLFYFYEFFARVAPGVLQGELTKVSSASDGAFGFAMSLYFLAYAPAQLLVGRLLDRHGVRAVAALRGVLLPDVPRHHSHLRSPRTHLPPCAFELHRYGLWS